MNKGKLFIVSAPSGAGKTSLVKQLVSNVSQVKVSVSHTTRKIRDGEKQGKDYFFSSVNEFKEMVTENDFLEHAQVFDNFYGTAQKTVENLLNDGMDVILEIDWQGAGQVRKMLPECVSIFILPPSIEVLRQRLENRGQDSEETIDRRMKDAVKEIEHCNEFDYLIVNDDFNLALAELIGVVVNHRLKVQQQLKTIAPLLKKLIAADI